MVARSGLVLADAPPPARVGGLHVVIAGIDEGRRAVLAGASILRLAVGDGTTAALTAGRGLRDLGTPFYVVDDIDAALELGAEGVHLESCPDRVEAARAAGLRVGVTADGDGVGAGVDYVEVRRGGDRLGDERGFEEWLLALSQAAVTATTPLVANGARDAAQAAACIAAGATGVTVGAVPRDRALRAALDAATAARGRSAARGQR